MVDYLLDIFQVQGELLPGGEDELYEGYLQIYKMQYPYHALHDKE